MDEKCVWVKCEFSRGGFPTERIFRIKSPQGGIYRGVAPSGYCYGTDKKALGDAAFDKDRVPGRLPGIAYGTGAGGTTRVQLPDGEIYDLGDDVIEAQPAAATA